MSHNRYYKSKKYEEKTRMNQELEKKYPPFHIPENLYEIVFINKYTNDNLLQKIISHVESCHEYTIDTEGKPSTGETILVQIETIPEQSPKFIMLLELAHLPSNRTTSKNLIKNILHLIFRSGNILNCWGDLTDEFSKIKEQELLGQIHAESFNLQEHFKDWYNWARSSCEGCSLSNRIPCHDPSPYRSTESWSLQRAMICVAGLFIDKSITVTNWAVLLDPRYTSLSRSVYQQRIHYVTYDCLATTYLTKAVRNYWTFNELTNKNFNELILSSSSQPSRTVNINNNNNNIQIMIKNKPTKSNKVKQINGQLFGKVLTDGLEDVSDDDNEEIYFHQLIAPADFEHKWGSVDLSRLEPGNISNIPREVSITTVIDDTIQQREHTPDNPSDTITSTAGDVITQQVQSDEVNYDNILLTQVAQNIIDDQEIELNEPPQREPKSAHQRRSRPAKVRHNRKRARRQKDHRFDYPIRREFYYRFKSFMIKKILRLYQIPFVHMIKERDGVNVKIGLRNGHLQQQAEHDLPTNIFSRRSYFYYKNKYKW